MKDNYEEFAKLAKKQNKGILRYLIIIIVVIFIIIGGIFIYIKTSKTAAKYIDYKIQNIKNELEFIFDNNITNNIETINIFDEDAKINGNYKIAGAGDLFKEYNDDEIRININSSLNNNYMNIVYKLKENNKEKNGEIYFDNNKLYINNGDSLQNKYILNNNILDKSRYQNVEDLLVFSELKDFIFKTLDALGGALKESIISSKIKGFNIEYTYEFNKNTIDKINNNLISSINKDSKYINIINNILGNNYNLFSINNNDNITIKIETSILNNKINNINIIKNGNKILSKEKENTYKLTYNDESYVIITLNDDGFSAHQYNNGNEFSNTIFSYSNKNIKFSYEGNNNNIKITFDLEKTNEDALKIESEVNLSLFSININSNILVDNKLLILKGNVKTELSPVFTNNSSAMLNVYYYLTYEHGDNIVSRNINNESDYVEMDSKYEIQTDNIINFILESIPL